MKPLQILAIVLIIPPAIAFLYFTFWVMAQPIGAPNPVFYWPVVWMTAGCVSLITGMLLWTLVANRD